MQSFVLLSFSPDMMLLHPDHSLAMVIEDHEGFDCRIVSIIAFVLFSAVVLVYHGMVVPAAVCPARFCFYRDFFPGFGVAGISGIVSSLV